MASRFRLPRSDRLLATPLRRVLVGLGPFVGVALFQIFMLANPLIVTLGLIGAVAGIGPWILFGLDLLTLTPLVFFARYTGIAMVAKTLLLQPLETNLSEPLTSYALVAGFLATVSLICMVVRSFDRGRGLIPQPIQLVQLRKIVILSTAMGVVGTLMSVGSASRNMNIASSGAVNQIGAILHPFLMLGIIAEVVRAVRSTNGSRPFTPSVILLLGISFILTFITNSREFFLDCLVAITVTMLLSGSVKFSHFVLGTIAAVVFLGFISPVVLASRQLKYGQSAGEFAAATVDLASKAATTPGYISDLEADRKAAAREHQRDQNDYFGNQAAVLNRLSWISLVDRVVSASKGHGLLQFSTIPEMTAQILPRFLFPDKPVARYIYSDYLAYQFGMEEEGTFGSVNFGLPMEGLVSFGLPGWFIYPILGIGGLVGLSALLVSLKSKGIYSIFFFCVFQHAMVEQTADGFINNLVRGIPEFSVLCYILYVATRSTRKPSSHISKSEARLASPVSAADR